MFLQPLTDMQLTRKWQAEIQHVEPFLHCAAREKARHVELLPLIELRMA